MTNSFVENNPDYEWHVTSEAREGPPGQGVVVITAESERYGRHVVSNTVDWPAGGELVDVERTGLALAFGSVMALADALRRRNAEIEI